MAVPAKPKPSKRAPDTAPRAAAKKLTLPYTGKEFLESLDDGREVWIYGERVKKITTHPAFQNGEVQKLAVNDAAPPLLFYGGRYGTLEPYREPPGRIAAPYPSFF